MANGKVRDRRREALWRRIVHRQDQSGLSVREFCRRCKLRETAFYFWRSELQRRQAEQEQRPAADGPDTPAFVPVRLAASHPERVEEHSGSHADGRIEIELPGGRRIHVTAPVDRAALADVLAVLRFDAITTPSKVEGEARPC